MPEKPDEFDSQEPSEKLSRIQRGLFRIAAPLLDTRERLYYWTCEKLGMEPSIEDLK